MSRPSLWLSETRLREAFNALDRLDTEGTMTGEEAEAFLATFVDREAAIERRDEFADFILEGDALVAAKRARARALEREADQLETGLARMRESVCTLMERAGVDELRGRTYALKLHKSRGRCVVIHPEAIPPEYFRTSSDRDLEIIARLVELAPDAHQEEALELLDEATRSRRAVDKTKIQETWKAAGGTDRIAHADGSAELLVPGAVKEVDTTLQIK